MQATGSPAERTRRAASVSSARDSAITLRPSMTRRSIVSTPSARAKARPSSSEGATSSVIRPMVRSERRIAARRLHRPLALHRDARAGAGVRPVVPHRAMLGAAIVPERDRVLGPAEAALEQRILRVLIEIGENGLALVARNADDEA